MAKIIDSLRSVLNSFEIVELGFKTNVEGDHSHSVNVDKDGNGETSLDAGHKHEVDFFKVKGAKGHSHELLR